MGESGDYEGGVCLKRFTNSVKEVGIYFMNYFRLFSPNFIRF